MLSMVVALALTVDGGMGFDSPIYGACAEYRDAGQAVETDAGWLVPQGRMSLVGCRLASCQTALSDAPAPQPALLPALAGAALGLGFGVVLGAVLAVSVLKK